MLALDNAAVQGNVVPVPKPTQTDANLQGWKTDRDLPDR